MGGKPAKQISAKRQWILDLLDGDTEVVFFEPAETFDEAIIGLGERINLGPVVVYSEQKILAALARGLRDSDDPHEAAREWYDFNTKGAWMGEGTPITVQEAP